VCVRVYLVDVVQLFFIFDSLHFCYEAVRILKDAPLHLPFAVSLLLQSSSVVLLHRLDHYITYRQRKMPSVLFPALIKTYRLKHA